MNERVIVVPLSNQNSVVLPTGSPPVGNVSYTEYKSPPSKSSYLDDVLDFLNNRITEGLKIDGKYAVDYIVSDLIDEFSLTVKVLGSKALNADNIRTVLKEWFLDMVKLTAKTRNYGLPVICLHNLTKEQKVTAIMKIQDSLAKPIQVSDEDVYQTVTVLSTKAPAWQEYLNSINKSLIIPTPTSYMSPSQPFTPYSQYNPLSL